MALLMRPPMVTVVDQITDTEMTILTTTMIMIQSIISSDGIFTKKLRLRQRQQLPAVSDNSYSTSYGINNCTFMKGGIGATEMATAALCLERPALCLERPKLKTRTKIEKKKKSEYTFELFGRKFVDAVLNEWYKTAMDLPPGLRQATEMGLLSSAQMVRFLAVNARPTTVRNISRKLPEGVSRAFIGRMIADPTFLYKFLLDQFATIGFTWWEVKKHKHRSKHEYVHELLNVLTKAACNAFVVWSLAPCRSYGNTFQYNLQNTLQKLPNNIFEKSYPLKEFDMQKRIHSYAYQSAKLFIIWFAAEGIQSGLSNFLAGKKDERVSVTVPSLGTNALGYGFLGLFANLRHQLMCGLDMSLINHFDVIGVTLFFSTALRIMKDNEGTLRRKSKGCMGRRLSRG